MTDPGVVCTVVIRPFDWLHPSTPSAPSALIPGVQRVGALLERLPIERALAGSLIVSATRG